MQTTLNSCGTGATAPNRHTWLGQAVAIIRQWRRQARTRQHLSRLGDHLLADIGLDRRAIDEKTGQRLW